MNCDVCTKEVNFIVFMLVVLFAISSWIDINGLWVELPILVQNLPEKWNLPSYMSVIIQIANIGPLAFMISAYIWPTKVQEVPVIYVIISVGAVACLLLAFFWNSVTDIAGATHSTALLILQFFLALVDCTSSVAFYPFMALLKPQYLTALFFGESLSGLVPSLVALGQGAGQITCVNATSWTNVTVNGKSVNTTDYSVYPKYQQPKFSIEIFFFFLFGMMLLSGLAFTLLNYLPYCKKEFIAETDSIGTSADLSQSEYSAGLENAYELSDSSDKHFLNAVTDDGSESSILASYRRKIGVRLAIQGQHAENVNSDECEVVKGGSNLSTFKFFILMLLTIWINALTNGVLPSVQSFSCLPYGNDTYHLAVTLSSMAAPIACFVVFFVQVKALTILGIFTVIGTGFASYVMSMAIMSPSPLFTRQPAGAPLIILAWILTTFVLTYCKVSVASEFRTGGRKALLWCGVFTQTGSAIGAFVMFILINQMQYYSAASPCLS